MTVRISETIDWLSLIDVRGPFLARGVIAEAFPQGFERVDSVQKRILRAVYEDWRDTVDEADSQLDEIHDAWIKSVICDALEYEDEVFVNAERSTGKMSFEVPGHGMWITPDLVVKDRKEKPCLLISIYPPGTQLEQPLPTVKWHASPMERMTLLCRSSEVRLGLITNGEEWMLVNAPIGGTSGYASWYARLWWQEPVTFRAFQSLLGVRRCFGPEGERLDQLLERSLEFQDEVTETLGEQVRRAIEMLIQSLGRADQDREGELLKDVSPSDLFESGLTLMMRLVFILCAEEQGLLLLGEPLYDRFYAVSTLRAQLREQADLYGLDLLERRHDAWCRLLSVFRIVYGGIEHSIMRMPALGGSLFDPDRFPFLEGRGKLSSWTMDEATSLPVDNRTVLLVLEALQVVVDKNGSQLLSFRALGVEQIGHVYEGLLEYKAIRVSEPTIGLIGSRQRGIVNVPLGTLESLLVHGIDSSIGAIADITGRGESTIKNALSQGEQEELLIPLIQACSGDESLARRIVPLGSLVRKDSWNNFAVYQTGSFAIAHGDGRRVTGTHYTPTAITEFIVRRTLEPLVYTGPNDGKPRKDWEVKAPAELLDLRVCDPAMGSGAFLVQVCRYLAELLVDSWDESENLGQVVTMDGVVHNRLNKGEPLPVDKNDRLLIARRLVAERCLYGVDLNPLAVELAKLSIWLVTLAKGRPFGYLDHNLRHGNSILGLSDLEQLVTVSFSSDVTEHQLGVFENRVRSEIRTSIELRDKLRKTPIREMSDIRRMVRLFREARERVSNAVCVADAITGEILKGSGNSTHIERALTSLRAQVEPCLLGDAKVRAAIEREASSNLSLDLSGGNSQRQPFHWPIEFPEVFSGPKRGFDAVVGNPPFLNAISESQARNDLERSYYQLVWPEFAQGAYDFSLLFWARTITHLLSSSGRYGMLSPTSMISKTGDWKTLMHRSFRPDVLQLYPIDYFKSARIRTTAICGGHGAAKTVVVRDLASSDANVEREIDWTEDENWFATVNQSTRLRPLDVIPLQSCVVVAAGCTTGDAYKLKAEVEDSLESKGPKLVTTGALDRYLLKWGTGKIRYLKDDYEYPRWPLNSEHRSVNSAMKRQRGLKILVAGYTSIIESWLDLKSESAGVVQTWSIKYPGPAESSIGTPWMSALCGVLNSAIFSRIFAERNGANAMTGSYIVVKKKALLQMPIPNVFRLVLDGTAKIAPPFEPLVDVACWSVPENHASVLWCLSEIVNLLQGLDPGNAERDDLDLLGHYMVSSLYSADLESWRDDLLWWCARSRTEVDVPDCRSLAAQHLPRLSAGGLMSS